MLSMHFDHSHGSEYQKHIVICKHYVKMQLLIIYLEYHKKIYEIFREVSLQLLIRILHQVYFVQQSSTYTMNKYLFIRHYCILDRCEQATVIGITKPPPKDGAWSALLHSCLRQTQTDYKIKRSERPLLRRLQDPDYRALQGLPIIATKDGVESILLHKCPLH